MREVPRWRYGSRWHRYVPPLLLAIATIVVLELIEFPASVLSVLGLMLIWSAIHSVHVKWQLRQLARDQNMAAAAAARGDFSIATDTYWRWAKDAITPHHSALARHNLAWMLMRRGYISQAIEVLSHNEAHFEAALKEVGMSPTSACDLSLLHSLQGDLDGAERWLKRADERKDQLASPSLPAMKSFARAVFDCRSGRSSSAAAMLADRWSEIEGLFTGSNTRLLRVVRAFAVSAEGPRAAGLGEQLLASTKPLAFPGEYDFLGASWPEMHAFLATHELSSTPPCEARSESPTEPAAPS